MVKRPYNAPRRREQADATRTAVLAAAHQLFLGHGYPATSIRQVAAAARVGEQTVYRLFETKAALLREVLMAAVSGGSDGSSGPGATFIQQLAETPGARERLRLVGEWSLAGYERGSADLELAVHAAAESDPRVRELAQSMRELRYREVAAIVRAVAGDAGPPPGLTYDEVADYIYAIWSAPVYDMLVNERGWTARRYIEWCVDTVDRLFLGHIPEPQADR